jgi:hypothetical protein
LGIKYRVSENKWFTRKHKISPGPSKEVILTTGEQENFLLSHGPYILQHLIAKNSQKHVIFQQEKQPKSHQIQFQHQNKMAAEPKQLIFYTSPRPR